MPNVKIRLMGDIWLVAGRKEGEVELPEGSTVQTLIDELPKVFGGATGEKIVTRDGRLAPGYVVYVNGQHIGIHHYGETVLPSGQVALELMKSTLT